ncbi:l-type lectin-domain containing receptor kinase viii.2 [Quercus suber]|uniref:L-type lectin-domain containing receptor kinase viii.2 n=1 Tax=Quercus suber TaxID=58331 RepID=A0AAW0LJD0_QUESU
MPEPKKEHREGMALNCEEAPLDMDIKKVGPFFTFSVTNLNPSLIGGGLAFVISPDEYTVGDAGGFLGLVNATGSPSGFLAVEFDTLMDVEFKDINGNHVGLDLNSMVSTQVSDLDATDIDLKSGDAVNAWIEYDRSSGVFNKTVSYSNLKPKEPLLSFNLDLDQYVNDLISAMGHGLRWLIERMGEEEDESGRRWSVIFGVTVRTMMDDEDEH